ncbi:MAG: hypothetical protein JST54_19325 [Deltaproteobacteria bacterium]|nr:hypothetical protein [Deltaproteobacteria bacterium]
MLCRPTILLLLCGALACAPESPDRGTYLGDGTALATFAAHGDGAEPFDVDVVFPSQANGAPQPGPFPGAVILPDDGVDRTSYRWLAQALAKQGFVVAMPEMSLGKASVDPDRANVSHDLLRSDRGLLKGLITNRVALLGHGAGGETALHQAVNGPFQALVLLANAPVSGDEAEKVGAVSLVVVGTSDCALSLADAQAGWSRLPSPSVFVQVVGATHTQFTDDDSADRADCEPGTSLQAAHQNIATAVAEFLRFALESDQAALGALEEGTADLSVETR